MNSNDDHLNQNTSEEKAKILKNGYQSATHYVQNAIENASQPTQDATQNLVNNVMKKRRK